MKSRIITVEGVGDLSAEASTYIFAEARRTHRSLAEVTEKIIRLALVRYQNQKEKTNG